MGRDGHSRYACEAPGVAGFGGLEPASPGNSVLRGDREVSRSVTRRACLVNAVHASLAVLILTVAARASTVAAPPSGSPSPAPRRSAPKVLVGPVRIKLVSGRTLDGIAVFREETRVRLVLDDGSEIAFEPSKVVSVTALADIPAEPTRRGAPSGGASRSVPGRPTSAGAPTPEISEKDLAARSTRESRRKIQPSRAGSGESASKTASSGRASASSVRPPSGPSETLPAGKKVASEGDAASITASGDANGSDDAVEVPNEDAKRKQDIADLAAMLEHAILNVDTDRRDSGLPDEETEGVQVEPPPSPEAAKKEQPYTRPKPEDFDATRPVIHPGVRFLGRKGDLPSTPPPLPDFPRPAEPTVSLGASIWHPTSGFSSSAKWPKSLAPATSFSTSLSGLPPPATGLRPTWWNPKPIQWPSSIFPENWQPTDGFAQTQQSQESNPSPSSSAPAGSQK